MKHFILVIDGRDYASRNCYDDALHLMWKIIRDEGSRWFEKEHHWEIREEEF